MPQEAQLEDEVELQAEPGRILISKTAQPRAGWAEAARRMRAEGEDRLLDAPTALDSIRKSGSGESKLAACLTPKPSSRELVSELPLIKPLTEAFGGGNRRDS